ncbi:MAG: hypothetical protein WBC63_09910, partial [Candidatus Bipolaricaulia bacterium]
MQRSRLMLVLGAILGLAAGAVLAQGITGPTEMTSLDQDTFIITVTNASATQDACEIVVTNTVPNATFVYVLGTSTVTLHDAASSSQNPDISGLDLVWDINAIFGTSYQLPPGESITIQFDLATTANAISGTDDVTMDYVDCSFPIVPFQDTDTQPITILQESDLSLTKSVNVFKPTEGDPVIYTIALSNAGPDAATNVAVADEIQFGLDVTSAIASHGSYDENAGTWTVGTLGVGETATLTIETILFAASTIDNIAEVSAVDQLDPDSTPGNFDPVEDDQATAGIIGLKTFDAGSCIIDMGDQPASTALEVYGLIYDLVVNAQIPVYWSIDCPQPATPPTFIIPSEYSGEAAAILAAWPNVTVDCSATAPFTEPINDVITSFPNAVLDLQNGGIAEDYYGNSGVSEESYISGSPSDLGPCNDVYILPHADPQGWSQLEKDTLYNFILGGGNLWAACHAVSAMEGPTADGLLGWYFLSTQGLIPWGDHDDGTPPYTYDSTTTCDPFMQFDGTLDGATTNGSEQVYLPIDTWRSTTTLAVYDPDHPDSSEAGIVVYGPAFGNPDYGTIMYEAGHSHDNGTDEEKLAAQSGFFNFLLQTGIDTRPKISNVQVPDPAKAGNTYTVSAEVTDATPPYSYLWASSCGGTFADETAPVTTFTAPPVLTETDCLVRLTVVDACGREVFTAESTTILPVYVDLATSKVVSDDNPQVGDTAAYTITVTNLGPEDATFVEVEDVLPAGVTYASYSATVGAYDPGTGVWTVGDLAIGQVETLTLNVSIDTGTGGLTISNTATASTDYNVDVNLTNNVASDDLAVQGADLAVTKVVDNPLPNEGDTIVYTITVTNLGPNDTTNVSLLETLSAGTTYVSDTTSKGTFSDVTYIWTVGDLAVAETATLAITATVSPGTAGQTLVNDASVFTSDQPDPVSANNTATASITVPIADLSLTKTVNDANPSVGNTITYTITVVNNGPNDATGVEVNDALPAGLTYVSSVPSSGTYDEVAGLWTIGIITSGDSDTLTITATVDVGVGGQTITNTAIAGSSSFDPDLTDNTASVDLLVKHADLSVTKSVSDTTPDEGQTIRYTVTVRNNGPDSIVLSPGAIQVSDAIPECTTFVKINKAEGDNAIATYDAPSRTVSWQFDALNNGQARKLEIDVSIDAGCACQTIVNEATVTPTTIEDGDLTNNTGSVSTVVNCPDLTVLKLVNDTTPDVGQEITYEIRVTNSGQADILLSPQVIEVLDVLPDCLTFTKFGTIEGQNANAAYDSGTRTVTWTFDEIDAGQTRKLQIKATVNADCACATIMNTATVSTTVQEISTDNNSASVDVVVNCADVSLTKTITDSLGNPLPPPYTPASGANIFFTIEVCNEGNIKADNVLVEDVLPTGLSFVAVESVSRGNYNDGSGVWNVGDFDGGVCEQLILEVQVTASVNTVITNYAYVTRNDAPDGDSTPGPIADPNNLEDDEAAVTLVVGGADLAVTKIADEPTKSEGGAVIYTITVTNLGTNAAAGVTVTDALPAGVTYFASSATVGSYNQAIDTWQISNLASGATATLTVTATVDAGTAGQTLTNTASVTGNQEDPDLTNNEDSTSIFVGSADLALTKTVDVDRPNTGETVTFTIVTTNGGPNDATGVQVADLLPAGLTYVSHAASLGTYDSVAGLWSIGTLLYPGGSAALTITASVDAGTAGQTFTNTATVTGDPGDPDPSNNTDSADVTVKSADLAVSKTVSDQAANEGDTIVYTLTVTNLGPDATSGVVIEDDLPSGVTYVSDSPSQGIYDSITGEWTLGALAVSATATLEITVTIDAGTGGTTIANVATVTASDVTDPNPANDADFTDAVITVPLADLSITKSVEPGSVNEGDSVVFTVIVTNNGPDKATGIQVTDVCAPGLTYVSHTVSQGTYNSGTGLWDLGSLANGAQATLTMTTTAEPGTGGTTQSNTAIVTAVDQADPTTPNRASSSVYVQAADVAVTKVVDDPTPNEGNTITFTITATNNGPDAATSLEITDGLPAGLTLVSAVPGLGTYDSGSSVWTVGTLTVGATATLTVTATVDAGTGGQTLINTAAVSAVDQADPVPGNDSDDAQVTVQSADLAVTKIVSDSSPNAGDTITFTITVTNNGPDTATGVSLTDGLPAGLAFVSATPSAGTSYDNGPGVWTVGGLPAGSSATLTVTATVDSGTGGDSLTNTVSVTAADQADPVSGNNSASATVTPTLVDIAVVKTVDEPAPGEGDTIVFTITLTNNGPDLATEVWIEDILPAGITFVSTLGVYDPVTGLWDAGGILAGGTTSLQITATVDVGTGGQTITNTATLAAVDQEDSDPTNNSDSASITVPAINPAISISKTPATQQVVTGGTATFTIVVTNTGDVPLTDVAVTDANAPDCDRT